MYIFEMKDHRAWAQINAIMENFYFKVEYDYCCDQKKIADGSVGTVFNNCKEELHNNLFIKQQLQGRLLILYLCLGDLKKSITNGGFLNTSNPEAHQCFCEHFFKSLEEMDKILKERYRS